MREGNPQKAIKTGSKSSVHPLTDRLGYLDVLRLLCTIEIMGFHWLRAAHVTGLFGVSGTTVSLADAYWGDSGRGLEGVY